MPAMIYCRSISRKPTINSLYFFIYKIIYSLYNDKPTTHNFFFIGYHNLSFCFIISLCPSIAAMKPKYFMFLISIAIRSIVMRIQFLFHHMHNIYYIYIDIRYRDRNIRISGYIM